MKVRVPMMVDDGRFAPLDRPDLIEGFDIDREEAFYDGPATTRVVVVDRDERTGALLPGAQFVPPRKDRVLGTYKGAYPVAVTSRTFNQVSVFATVLKTIYMYEEPDTLGRRVRWVRDTPRLTIVPRAGIEENAFYNHQTVALLFHSFRCRTDPSIVVHTSLARDIVAPGTPVRVGTRIAVGRGAADALLQPTLKLLTQSLLGLRTGIAVVELPVELGARAAPLDDEALAREQLVDVLEDRARGGHVLAVEEVVDALCTDTAAHAGVRGHCGGGGREHDAAGWSVRQ